MTITCGIAHNPFQFRDLPGGIKVLDHPLTPCLAKLFTQLSGARKLQHRLNHRVDISLFNQEAGLLIDHLVGDPARTSHH